MPKQDTFGEHTSSKLRGDKDGELSKKLKLVGAIYPDLLPAIIKQASALMDHTRRSRGSSPMSPETAVECSCRCRENVPEPVQNVTQKYLEFIVQREESNNDSSTSENTDQVTLSTTVNDKT